MTAAAFHAASRNLHASIIFRPGQQTPLSMPQSEVDEGLKILEESITLAGKEFGMRRTRKQEVGGKKMDYSLRG
jgi:hypothetical protein